MDKLKFFILFLFIFSSLCISRDVSGEQPDRGFFSLRGGFSEKGLGNSKESFSQYEGSLTLMLPWEWRPFSKFWIKTGIDFTAGVLAKSDKDVFIGSIGPRISLRTPGQTFSLDLGTASTYIDSYEFDDVDFGGTLQFTSYAGLYVQLMDRWRLGYRFQHMSNAGIYAQNDGLNLHMFEAGMLF